MQVVETDRARALTIDCQIWEIQFLRSVNNSEKSKRSYVRVATIHYDDILEKNLGSSEDEVDERVMELINFLAEATLPFPAADIFEFWLLDAKNQTPLALIYTCMEEDQKRTFPERAEWTALPAAVMSIDRTEQEKSDEYAPINYQLERLVAERAGFNAKAQWFTQPGIKDETFPSLLLTEDWQEEASMELCQRYLQRQSPRLLMLHDLNHALRKQLEINARAHAHEVERFHLLYPEIVDQSLIDTIRVEARLRRAIEDQPAPHKSKAGIVYT